MKKPKSFQKKPEKLTGHELTGLLVAHYGGSAEVENAHGQIIRCHLRKNAESVSVGDQVLWILEQDGTGTIVDHLPRKSLLARPERKDKLKAVAANIDIMIIVTAPPPILSLPMIDRYIVAAENLKITPIIVMNKMDLLSEEQLAEMNVCLGVYKSIGYQVLFSSTYTNNGMHELENILRDKNGVLVGQSGVGKSSITRHFVQEDLIRVGETSMQGLGKHTTTMSRLFHLPQGGNLIDSPGVREFGLWHMDKSEIELGFVEFKEFSGQCKFRDCEHLKEPGCAVQKAVTEGKISELRFESFKEMVNMER